jgi:GLPGLI family protein
MNRIFILHNRFSVLIGLLLINFTPPQKSVSELTIVYDYLSSPAANSSTPSQGSESATHTIYIKGNMTRSEMSSALYNSAIIFDANTKSGVILKEVSGQKLLIRVSAANWIQINKPYESLVFVNSAETKTIAGYKCIKAIASIQDGYTITVFYTNEIIPANKNYNGRFRNLNGLPLEYELNNGKLSIKYVVSKINLNPVPVSKFDIPKSGYREMSYEESKKLNTIN